jgi:amidase
VGKNRVLKRKLQAFEDSARIAYRELVRWVSAETGMAEDEAYMLLTMCGKVRLGNMVDPKYTIGASIARNYLE